MIRLLHSTFSCNITPLTYTNVFQMHFDTVFRCVHVKASTQLILYSVLLCQVGTGPESDRKLQNFYCHSVLFPPLVCCCFFQTRLHLSSADIHHLSMSSSSVRTRFCVAKVLSWQHRTCDLPEDLQLLPLLHPLIELIVCTFKIQINSIKVS